MSDYESYLRKLQQQQSQQRLLADTLIEASATSADEFARMKQLSKAAQIDMELLPQFKSEAEQANYLQQVNIGKLWRDNPVTSRALSNPEIAGLAHDDVQNMGFTETLLNSTKRGWLALQTAPDTLALHALGERLTAIENIDRRIAAGESPKQVLGSGYYGFTPIPWATPEQEMPEWHRQRDIYLTELRDRSGRIAALNVQRNAIPLPSVTGAANEKTFGGFLGAFIKSPFKFLAAMGPESTVQSLPGMVGGRVSGPFAPVVMGASSFATDYSSSLIDNLQGAGVDVTNPLAIETFIRNNPFALRELSGKAAKHAVVVGTVDGISGGVAGKFLLPKKEAAKGMAKFIARELTNVAVQTPIQGALGGIGEAGGQIYAGEAGDVGAMLRKAGEGRGAEALSDLGGGLHWGKVMSEVVGEMVGAPGEVASIGWNGARARYAQISHARQSAQAVQALQGAQVVAELNQASAQSKLRQRDPQAYESLVAAAAAGGELQNVFIDAHTLMQSGVAEQVAAVSPAVAAQLQEAAQTGGQIAIPMEEYASKIAPTEYAQQLADHLRTDPEGMTPAEAKAWQGSEAQAQFEQDAARAQAEHTTAQGQEQDTAAVAQTVQQQLDTAGRFTPEVNQKYATLVGEFFSAAAQKMGTTAQALYQRFPLQVAADLGFGKEVYSQHELTPQGVTAKWQGALQALDASKPDRVFSMPVPTVLRAFGVADRALQLPTRALMQIASKHRDVPASVLEQLPALLSDPLYVFAHKDGGYSAVVDTATAKGEPIIAGVRDGRVRTLTPMHDRDGGASGQQALLNAVRNALSGPGKVYARNSEALAKARASEGGAYRNYPVERSPRDKASIFTREHLVKRYGEGFYQEARGAFNPNTLQISLLKDADLSTFLHETGHFFLEMTAHLAAQADAPASFAQDMAVFFDWVGFTGEGAKTTPAADEAQGVYEQAGGGSAARSRAWQANPLRAFLGEHGLALDLRNEFAPGRAEQRKAMVPGYGPIFRRNGLSLDMLAERAMQEGFLPPGNTDANALYGMIAAALRGEKVEAVYASGYEEVLAEQHRAQQEEQARAWAETEEVPWSLEALAHDAAIVEDTVIPDLGANSNVSDAEFMRALGFTEQEIAEHGKNQLPQASGRPGTAQGDSGFTDAFTQNVARDPQVRAQQAAREAGSTTSGNALPLTPAERLAAWQSLSLDDRRPYHEQFARGFEAYLMEGKAPSPALQGLFGTFRAWLLKVYERITALDVRLTDEVRGVFDRMLASGEEIALAEQGRSMLPLFESAEQLGGTPEEFAAYQALGQSATQDAVDNLQARSIRDMQWFATQRASMLKQLQRQAKAQRDAVHAEVAAQVRSEPAYVAWAFLTGKPDGDAPAGRLSLAALQDMGLPAEAVNVLQARKMTSAEGMHPDVVAESVKDPEGNPLFDSGDALVRAVAAAPDMQVAINDHTDAHMLQEYGDLSSQEAIEKAADRAIHNEARARFVATEANALADAVGQRRVLAAAARAYALQAIDRLKVRHLRPGQYTRAEVRAARAADTAFRKGDIATAAAEKRNQLLQVQLARAAHEAQAYVDSSLKFLKKFDSDAVRRKIGADYADQIDTLLERFDLRSGQSLRAIDKRASLAQWIAQQQDRGLDPQISPELANEALRMSYKDLTVEELRGLVDTVKQIDHLGRLKNRILTDKKQRDYEVVRNGMAQTVVENARQAGKNTGTPATWLGKRLDGLKGFGAAHIKAATWARILDGGKDGGAWWSALIRPANERAAWETQQRAASTQALMAIWKPVLKNVPYMNKVGKGKRVPELGLSFNWEQRIGFALNYGNESNAQRLRDGGLAGRGALTDAQVQAVLRTLTAAEWQAVQASWDHLESFKEQIAAKERRLFGKEPEWIEARPFVVQTADGQTVALRGGYYPVKYDPHATIDAHQHANAEDAKNAMKAAYSAATTQRSFTKQRADEVHGRPLLLSMQGLYSGVNDVIHDLAFHEWAIDANRLMGSRTLDALVREHYGPHVKMELEKWVNDVVAGSKRLDSAQERAAGFFRRNVSVAALGFNAMSALMQPLGITQSFARVGTGWVAKGLGQYLAGPIEATAQVKAKSAFMENRTRTLFRDLNEIANKVAGQTSAREWVGRNAYFLTGQFQQFIDIPTWLGAYEKGVAQGFDEDTAVALADQAVKDSQGGGEEVDQSGITRGGPMLKLFTCFYDFMNTQANVLYLSAKTKRKGAAFWDFMMVAVVTPILVSALKDAITPGDSGEWDDPKKIAKKAGQEVATNFIGLFAFAREFTATAKALTGDKALAYSGPSGVRMVGNAQKLAQQTAQGEFDAAFTRSLIDFTGDVTGLPAVQPNRSIKGVQAVAEGKTEGVYETLAAPVFGFQKQH